MRKRVSGAICMAAVLGLLAGCGGGSSTAGNAGGGALSTGSGGSQSSGSGTTGSGGSTAQTIQGIATPSAVSVVTANNAN